MSSIVLSVLYLHRPADKLAAHKRAHTTACAITAHDIFAFDDMFLTRLGVHERALNAIIKFYQRFELEAEMGVDQGFCLDPGLQPRLENGLRAALVGLSWQGPVVGGLDALPPGIGRWQILRRSPVSLRPQRKFGRTGH